MSQNNNKKQNTKAKPDKNKTIKIIIIVVAALVVLVVAFLFFKSKNPKAFARLGIERASRSEKNTEYSRGVTMPGWASLTIPANTTNIDRGIDFYNPDSNIWFICDKCGYALDENYKCINENCGEQYSSLSFNKSDCYYMSFALYLKENDELLYESKLVQPGDHIQNITISRPLAPGTYEAYVFIQPYLSDQATPCNNGKVDITLNVK